MTDDLLLEYLSECREHLTGIENDLLALQGDGTDMDEERVNKVFRAAHSIKGGAGFFDLSTIKEVAHRIENVLDLFRSRRLRPSDEIVNELLAGFDVLREMVDDPEASRARDVAQLTMRLQEMAAAGLPQASKDSLARTLKVRAPEMGSNLYPSEFDLACACNAGKTVYLIQCDLIHDVQRRGKAPLQMIRDLIDRGTLLDLTFDIGSAGTLEDPISNELNFHFLYATAETVDGIAELIGVPRRKISIADRNGGVHPLAEAEETPEIAPDPLTTRPAAEATTQPAAFHPIEASPATSVAEATVRLTVTLLDSLMNLAGELVLGRNQLSDAITRQDPSMILAASQRISLITSNLQETVMRTRMQPIGNLFQRFPRQVREIAGRLGKSVRLVTEGADVELDKTIIEGLGDPLTHMVRNAIDHGIEGADERIRKGKPAEGSLSLRAWHEAGQVVIEVADDGRGLNADKIAASAISKGAISAEAVASIAEREKLALLLLPGVSTAATVTDLSGRGVGMDVVKTNLDRLGGKIDIASEPEKGTSFRVTLPLTLAIIPSLLVSVGGERVAIPQANVQQLLRIPSEEASQQIDRVGTASVLMLSDGLIPLVDLRLVLDEADEARGASGDAIHVVLLAGGGCRYGLVVDHLHTTVEIVVKPLGRHIKHLGQYSGATILGDGRVALILNVPGLAKLAGLEFRELPVVSAETCEARAEIHQLLLFRNSPAEPCAVPLELVARVEKIRPDQVEGVGGRLSMQYRGGTLPLITLADAASVSKFSPDRDAIVVVLQMSGREIGLLGLRPVDVIETDGDIDPFTLRQPGIAGSVILRGHTTLLADPFELADRSWPGWNAEVGVAALQTGSTATVLVVEDSVFFREHISGILQSAGYKVVSAPDGQTAWELLHSRGHEFSLVVTDVEMPRMDGLELTRRLRGDHRVSHLPVLMLSSLAGDESMKRGYDAGATAYSVKIDRDELIAAVQQLLGHRDDLGNAGDMPGIAALSRHVTKGNSEFEISGGAVCAGQGEAQ